MENCLIFGNNEIGISRDKCYDINRNLVFLKAIPTKSRNH